MDVFAVFGLAYFLIGLLAWAMARSFRKHEKFNKHLHEARRQALLAQECSLEGNRDKAELHLAAGHAALERAKEFL